MRELPTDEVPGKALHDVPEHSWLEGPLLLDGLEGARGSRDVDPDAERRTPDAWSADGTVLAEASWS